MAPRRRPDSPKRPKAPSDAPMRPFIVALAGQKGGVGKTTTATAIAAEWCARRRRVLLVDTDRQRFFSQRLADQEGIPVEVARERIAQTVAALRMGTPEEFGDACAFLCSVQAGFISGQNLQLDGGSYMGLI